MKISLLSKKCTNFTDKQLENSSDYECEIFRVLPLYGHEHIGRFSNLHQCTFKDFFSKCDQILSFQILNEKLHFLCSVFLEHRPSQYDYDYLILPNLNISSSLDMAVAENKTKAIIQKIKYTGICFMNNLLELFYRFFKFPRKKITSSNTVTEPTATSN